jgi:hypothetical protein
MNLLAIILLISVSILAIIIRVVMFFHYKLWPLEFNLINNDSTNTISVGIWVNDTFFKDVIIQPNTTQNISLKGAKSDLTGTEIKRWNMSKMTLGVNRNNKTKWSKFSVYKTCKFLFEPLNFPNNISISRGINTSVSRDIIDSDQNKLPTDITKSLLQQYSNRDIYNFSHTNKFYKIKFPSKIRFI